MGACKAILSRCTLAHGENGANDGDNPRIIGFIDQTGLTDRPGGQPRKFIVLRDHHFLFSRRSAEPDISRIPKRSSANQETRIERGKSPDYVCLCRPRQPGRRKFECHALVCGSGRGGHECHIQGDCQPEICDIRILALDKLWGKIIFNPSLGFKSRIRKWFRSPARPPGSHVLFCNDRGGRKSNDTS